MNMKNKEKEKRQARVTRHKRVRSKIYGTSNVPRLSLYRSNKGLFIQLIDDKAGKTLVSVSDKDIKDKKTKTDTAKEAGKLIAKKALKKNINEIVFDRSGYKYHGRVKAVADGAREEGLKF
jgi:large subunit ribosomal protein L18